MDKEPHKVVDICPQCNGTGDGDTTAEHGCDGTEKICNVTCPVPFQKPCGVCGGSGDIEMVEVGKIT